VHILSTDAIGKEKTEETKERVLTLPPVILDESVKTHSHNPRLLASGYNLAGWLNILVIFG